MMRFKVATSYGYAEFRRYEDALAFARAAGLSSSCVLRING